MTPRRSAAIKLHLQAGMQRYRERYPKANIERLLREINARGSCELMGLLIESHLANYTAGARCRTVHVFDASIGADVHKWVRQHLKLIEANFPCCDVFYYRFNADGSYAPCWNLLNGRVVYPSAANGALYPLP